MNKTSALLAAMVAWVTPATAEDVVGTTALPFLIDGICDELQWREAASIPLGDGTAIRWLQDEAWIYM